MKRFYWASVPTISRIGAVMFPIVLALFCLMGGMARAAESPPAFAESNIKNGVARQLVSDGLKAYRSGNTRLGITLLKRAEEAAPDEVWVHFLLGRALLQARDAASAERYLRQARRNGLADELVLPSLFDAMIMRHAENKLLNEFPAPADGAKGRIAAQILHGRAMAMLSLDRVDDAGVSMDRALSLVRDSASLLERSKIALLQNNPLLARTLIDEAFKRDPQNGRVMLAKLDDLIRSNDDAGALALSDRILKRFPLDLTSRAARIEIFLKNKQDAKAKSELGAILAKTPNAPMGRYYQAVFLARANKTEEAWKIVQTLPPIFGIARPAYVIQLSQIAIDSGHVEFGATILAKGLAHSPDQTDLRLRLAAIRLRQETPRAAVLLLTPIKDSRDPRALDLLGFARFQAGDTKGALDALKRANQLLPQDGQIGYHLALALNENGDRKAARALLEKLLASGREFDDREKARELAQGLRR